VAIEPGRWQEHLDEYLHGRGIAWGAYNVVHPEPAQRDRVLRTDEIATLCAGRNLPVENFLYQRLGSLGDDTMRVLVCDGPSLLGWLGIMQPTKTTQLQRELFEHVVPAFQRRLAFERVVSESSLATNALAAALEATNGAAWMLGPFGQIVHANAAGRARIDRDRAATLDALDACVHGTAEPRFKVRAVRADDGSRGHLVVELPSSDQVKKVPEAIRRLGLTPAQTRVFERVARGMSNATIAAELSVAERTVEAHVTAILVKAQVPSRAALIVRVLGD
jgi:DNA-binding CsgD family transcriptional regulator